ncbi:Uncharacterised protein [Yersinia frederiksenii]|nr:Uncharacterised protein [Yersinia frederiksenii]
MDKHIEELREAYTDVEIQAHNLRGNPEEYRAVTGFCPVNVIEMQAQKILALLAKLEAAEKEISDWRSIAEAAAQDDADWHNLADSKNEVISHLASGIIQLKERAEAVEAMTADVVRDANRYRFLRDKDCFGEQDAPGLVSADDIFDLDTGDFDAAVDGRMAAADIPFFNPVKLVLSTEDSEWKKRAEAAEARLLVPVKFDELADAVKHVTGGIRIEFDPKYDKGHHAVPFMNFNSLSRIVEVFRAAGYPVEGEIIATLAPAPAGVVMRPPFEKTLERCAAARDGECSHKDCPQIRDNEPMATGRHCPIDDWDD